MKRTLSGNSKPRINVAIAAEMLTDARRMVQQINAQPDTSATGYATTIAELEALLHLRKDVDVLVTDLTMEGRDLIPFIQQAIQRRPDLNVLCYTEHADEPRVIRAIQAGAMGYILKNAHEDLPTCVRIIYNGGSPVSPSIARAVIRSIYSRGRPVEPQEGRMDVTRLSARETEILQLLAKGIPFAEIGQILSISPHTVTAHIKKIYRKLQVHSRGEAVYEAQCMGLLPQIS